MIEIKADSLTKRFISEQIFKDFSGSFSSGESYAIIGPNGSGKSTLLKTLAGFVPTNSGNLKFFQDGTEIDPDDLFKFLVFVSPYLELIEEFTLTEFLKFHFKMKPLQPGFDLDSFIEITRLEAARSKEILNFSSGMKQRLKLGLAFCSDSEVIFFDEPTTNLDEKGVAWYTEGVQKYLKERLLFIASNQLREYNMCEKTIDIQDFK